MKSKHLSRLIDVITSDLTVIDYSRANDLNYKSLTNAIFYGKKLYNKHKRVKDPILGRVDKIKDRDAMLIALNYVYNRYKSPGRKTRNASLSTTNTRMASPLPYHFDTFANMDDAWSNVSSRVKDGDDMSLLIKFYNTIVKESNSINQ